MAGDLIGRLNILAQAAERGAEEGGGGGGGEDLNIITLSSRLLPVTSTSLPESGSNWSPPLSSGTRRSTHLSTLTTSGPSLLLLPPSQPFFILSLLPPPLSELLLSTVSGVFSASVPFDVSQLSVPCLIPEPTGDRGLVSSSPVLTGDRELSPFSRPVVWNGDIWWPLRAVCAGTAPQSRLFRSTENLSPSFSPPPPRLTSESSLWQTAPSPISLSGGGLKNEVIRGDCDWLITVGAGETVG